MGIGRGCAGCGCGFVTVILLAVAGVVGYLLFVAQPARVADVAATPSATKVPGSISAAAAQFDKKIATTVAQTKTGGSKQPVRLVLTEEELTAKAAQAGGTASSGDVVQGVVVQIKEGIMVLTGRTQLMNREIPIEAEIKLSPVDNKLKVDVTSIKAGGLALPLSDAIRDTIADQIGRAVGGENLQGVDLGFDVKSVRLTKGQLEIEGQTR